MQQQPATFLIADRTHDVNIFRGIKSLLSVYFDPSSIIGDNFAFLVTMATEWWFVALCLLVSSFLFFISSKIFLMSKTSLVNQDTEKRFSTERVRGKIARDMNDNLGSELFGLKLMGQVALSKSSVSDKDKYLKKIVETSHHLIENVSEVIWISDFEQDNIFSLWNYLQKSALYYLKPSGISYSFDMPVMHLDNPLCGEMRHNILKFHQYFFQQMTSVSVPGNCDLLFTIQNKKLLIIISNFRSQALEDESRLQLMKIRGGIYHQKGRKTIIEIPLDF